MKIKINLDNSDNKNWIENGNFNNNTALRSNPRFLQEGGRISNKKIDFTKFKYPEYTDEEWADAVTDVYKSNLSESEKEKRLKEIKNKMIHTSDGTSKIGGTFEPKYGKMKNGKPYVKNISSIEFYPKGNFAPYLYTEGNILLKTSPKNYIEFEATASPTKYNDSVYGYDVEVIRNGVKHNFSIPASEMGKRKNNYWQVGIGPWTPETPYATVEKSGGKIHIKEKNKGSFTEYCGGEVTNECILRGKNSSDPAIRKKAVFALNARTWKHLDGGTIKSSLKTYSNEELLPGVFSILVPGINLSLMPASKTISELFVDPEEIEKTRKEKKEKEDINKTLNKLLNSGDILYQTLHPSLIRQSDGDENTINTTLSTEKDEDDIYPELKVPYKRQFGGNLYINYKPFEGVDRSLIPSVDNSLVFEDYSTPSEYELSTTKEKIQEDDFKLPNELRTPYSNSTTYSSPKEYKGKRYEVFKHYWNEYVSKDPSAAKYEGILTDIANHESRFNYSIKNTAGAPAYGYFQFWEDNKTKNITHYSGLSVEEFLKNPLALIAAAVKMARNIENSLTKNDLKMAAQKGYGLASLIRGAWLGGLGGVRQVLRGTGNPSDAKWYHGKSKGRSVKEVMDEQKHNIL